MAQQPGYEMNLTRGQLLVAGSMVAAAVACVIVAMSSISGFASSGSGDIPTAPMSGPSLAILVAGALIVSSLEFSTQRQRRARSAGMARVADHVTAWPVSPGRG